MSFLQVVLKKAFPGGVRLIPLYWLFYGCGSEIRSCKSRDNISLICEQNHAFSILVLYAKSIIFTEVLKPDNSSLSLILPFLKITFSMCTCFVTEYFRYTHVRRRLKVNRNILKNGIFSRTASPFVLKARVSQKLLRHVFSTLQ